MTTTMKAQSVKGVRVGDVFYRSWGYDQTNVNFYVVVGLTDKCVKLQECGSRAVVEAGGYTEVVADTTRRFGPVMTKRVKEGYSGPATAFNSYSDCYKWDGCPKYETGTGYGH